MTTAKFLAIVLFLSIVTTAAVGIPYLIVKDLRESRLCKKASKFKDLDKKEEKALFDDITEKMKLVSKPEFTLTKQQLDRVCHAPLDTLGFGDDRNNESLGART